VLITAIVGWRICLSHLLSLSAVRSHVSAVVPNSPPLPCFPSLSSIEGLHRFVPIKIREFLRRVSFFFWRVKEHEKENRAIPHCQSIGIEKIAKSTKREIYPATTGNRKEHRRDTERVKRINRRASKIKESERVKERKKERTTFTASYHHVVVVPRVQVA
jgi:hypothetical protein